MIYKNIISKDGIIIKNVNLFSNEELLDIFNTYNDTFLSILHELSPEKVNKYKSTHINLNISDKNANFGIHTDIKAKLLSVVVYICPETNIGTLLYDNKDGSNEREIKWKQNRAFIFSRSNDTWHNYKGNGKETRKKSL